MCFYTEFLLPVLVYYHMVENLVWCAVPIITVVRKQLPNLSTAQHAKMAMCYNKGSVSLKLNELGSFDVSQST